MMKTLLCLLVCVMATAFMSSCWTNPIPEQPVRQFAVSPANPKAKMKVSLFPAEDHGKWGYIDKRGRMVIPAHFDWADDFSEGLAVVKVGDNYGYIDSTGNFVFQPQFPSYVRSTRVLRFYHRGAMPFSEGLAAVTIMDRSRLTHLYGYIDKTGQVVIEPNYAEAGPFVEGLASVQPYGLFSNSQGYIDKTGKVVAEAQYEKAYSFSEGLGVVFLKNGWFRFLDKSGNVAIQTDYGIADSFSEGLAAVCVKVSEDFKWGFIDKTGKMVIEPQFYTAFKFSEGLAFAGYGNTCGFINKKGEMVIKPQFGDSMRYSCPSYFSEGLAAVWINWKIGFIDKSGHVVIDGKYDEAEPFMNGLARVKIGDRQRYINRSGETVWEQPWHQPMYYEPPW